MEHILSTVRPLPVETRVKAWLFQVETKFYQVVEYGGFYRCLPATTIWEANKRGKRISRELFTISKHNHIDCITKFVEKLNLEKEELEVEQAILNEEQQLEESI